MQALWLEDKTLAFREDVPVPFVGPGSVEVNLASVVVNEIMLVGSRFGPFASGLRLLASGAVDPAQLIVARYPLSKGLTAFEHAAQPGALKVLLEPPPS